MKIKKIEFPSFEEWWDNYYTKPYSVEGMWLYAGLCHNINGCRNAKSREEVKEWYDQSIKELNEHWEKYIRETSMED